MGKINILTPNVYNRIAAGEVVDRPYSVVKELVENAIDAGASEVEIRIEKGGKSYISVQDNGGGIEYSDLKSVFLPHATSKISKASDLENIHTLGFRGEAVASISAVSRMRYTSKCENSECYKIECNGGEIGEIIRASGADGTLVEVEDLFFNTPVRLKFLKSDKAEEGDITTFVYRFILSHPEISFKYYVDNRLIAQSFGEGEEETLVSVYGANILHNTYRIEAVKHGVKIRGYISNQNFFKPNRSYQSVFLNGRYIVNNTISAALTNAYAGYAMKRQYPFYVLYIDLPAEIVDVNVHPNKADVRFADNQVIYACIYSVISAVLDGNSKALEYVMPNTVALPTTPRIEEKVPVFTYEQAKSEIEAAKAKPIIKEQEKPRYTAEELPFEEVRNGDRGGDRDVIAEKAEKPVKAKKSAKQPMPYSDLFFEVNTLRVHTPEAEKKDDFFEENKRFLLEQEAAQKARKEKEQLKIDVDRCEYKGNLFNTFLIYEFGDNAYIIDQHAAHERLIFDRLKKKMENRAVLQQPMLLPYSLHTTPVEALFLEDCLPVLKEIGFDIAEQGATDFTVTAVPVDLQNISLDQFFAEVLHDVSGLRGIKLSEILKDRLAMSACKAAVKGGMKLTEEEVKQLLADMEGDTGLKCPHGRPAVVKLSKYEIEKMFKRIV
ncbi:MAG: DNA mismatch repair endonuclease MutL [Clostridia bacterium]|nr:DNA mismatch repair endonuclease MutL [Clostridia bacterium]